MNRHLAERLYDVGDLEIRRDYSGRGMDGRTTYALIGSLGELLEAMGNLTADLVDEAIGQTPLTEELERLNLRKSLSGIREDSMYHKSVFY